MDDELQKKLKEEKEKDNSTTVILFSSLLDVLLLVVELYLLTCMPQLLPGIVGVGLAILFDSYLLVSNIQKAERRKEEEAADRFSSLLKSEKASYLLIRKYCDEIQQQLNQIQESLEDPFQEVIAAQKATAKVTINRSKENADALMNSNDKLLDLVFSLEEKIDNTYEIIKEGMQTSEDHSKAEIMQKQQELISGMREMELTLRNEILQAVNKLSTVTPQVVMAAPQQMPMMSPQKMQQPVMMTAPEAVSSPVAPEPEEDLSLGDLDMDLGDLPGFTPMEAEEVQEPAVELEPIAEPEPIAELEPIAEPEPIAEFEPIEEPEPIAEPEPIVEPEPEPEPEPIVEEKPPMPDLSDPNKMMSPDDIAALLANMGGDDTPAAEPEPEPIVEEKPPMPDLSDPNKQMSPDEIAALFANMT